MILKSCKVRLFLIENVNIGGKQKDPKAATQRNILPVASGLPDLRPALPSAPHLQLTRCFLSSVNRKQDNESRNLLLFRFVIFFFLLQLKLRKTLRSVILKV